MILLLVHSALKSDVLNAVIDSSMPGLTCMTIMPANRELWLVYCVKAVLMTHYRPASA